MLRPSGGEKGGLARQPAAYRLSSDRRIKKGEADLITTGAWVGALYGLAVPYLAYADEDYWRLYLASSMVGVPAAEGALPACPERGNFRP